MFNNGYSGNNYSRRDDIYRPYDMPPHYELYFVDGRKEAESFRMDANSGILLPDKNPNISLIWLVTTDAQGYTRAQGLLTSPYVEPKEATVSELKETISLLQDEIRSLKEGMVNGEYIPTVSQKSKPATAKSSGTKYNPEQC